MKILAADIGGTNARFARVEIDGLSALEMSEPVVFPTWWDTIESFDHLLERYSADRPPGTPDVDQFDALSIAIAGERRTNGRRQKGNSRSKPANATGNAGDAQRKAEG